MTCETRNLVVGANPVISHGGFEVVFLMNPKVQQSDWPQSFEDSEDVQMQKEKLL